MHRRAAAAAPPAPAWPGRRSRSTWPPVGLASRRAASTASSSSSATDDSSALISSSPTPAARSRPSWTSSGSRASQALHLLRRPVALRDRPRSGRASGRWSPRPRSGRRRPGRPATTSSIADGRGHHVVAVDGDVADAVAGGPLLERGRVLGRRRGELGVAVVLAEEDHRQLPHGGQVHRLVERALGRRAVAEEGHRHARRRPGAGPRWPRPRRWAGPAATIPLAPKIPSFGSAMCIEPPRPRLVPWSLPISSANMPSGSRPLARQWPWPRWVEVMTSVGRERPARTDRRRLLPDREVDEARGPRRRGRARPPAPRTRGSPASAGASRGGRPSRTRRRGRVEGHGVCSIPVGRYNKGSAMIGEIEIPESFPSPGAVSGKRVVITGASRGLGAVLAHAFSHAGASVALVARTERDLKAVAERLPGPVPGAQRRRDRRGLQRGGGRRHRGRVGRRRRVDLQRRDLADRGRPAPDRCRRSGARSSR